MKKIINYKKYDTETARVVGNWISGSKEEDNYRDETLYCKKNGEYFLDDKGGMCSDYHTAFWIDYDCEHGDWEELIPFSKEEAQEWVIGTNLWRGGSVIIPLTPDEAKAWCEEQITYEE